MKNHMTETHNLSAEEATRLLNSFYRENQELSDCAHRLRAALEIIAAPMRPDGTWNRDREACRQIAEAALDAKRYGY